MKIITEPTVLADGDECDAIVDQMAGKASGTKDQHRVVLQAVLQHAFEQGMAYGQPVPKKRTEPAILPPVTNDKPTSVPPLRSWQDIKDEGAETPIEQFQLHQTPPSDATLWESQLFEALKYAARKYN